MDEFGDDVREAQQENAAEEEESEEASDEESDEESDGEFDGEVRNVRNAIARLQAGVTTTLQ
jgi:hypothetical protein